MNCKICGSTSVFFDEAKILNEYLIAYYRCGHCGFIQTEEPFWMDKAYANAINDSDIGMVSRNIANASVSKAIISVFFDPEARFVDYGAGYGILVRLMRDYGFDFYRAEKYCTNLFAKHFDFEGLVNPPVELLTAFEVFEHFSEPVSELDILLKLSSNILFSTELIPHPIPRPKEWWYYGLNHGQHISFYTLKALQHLASSRGLNYYSNKSNYHLLTKKSISPFLFNLICRKPISTMFSIFNRRTSLLAADYEKTTGNK